MQRATTKLRHLLATKDFLYWPSLYYPLTGLVARAGTIPIVADAGAGFGEPLHWHAHGAQLWMTFSFHHAKRALEEVVATGSYTGISEEENVIARQGIEDVIGLDAYYEIEEATVEDQK